MKANNYNTEVMNNLEKCGVETCLHYIAGLCSLCRECDFYEHMLIQEH